MHADKATLVKEITENGKKYTLWKLKKFAPVKDPEYESIKWPTPDDEQKTALNARLERERAEMFDAVTWGGEEDLDLMLEYFPRPDEEG